MRIWHALGTFARKHVGREATMARKAGRPRWQACTNGGQYSNLHIGEYQNHEFMIDCTQSISIELIEIIIHPKSGIRPLVLSAKVIPS